LAATTPALVFLRDPEFLRIGEIVRCRYPTVVDLPPLAAIARPQIHGAAACHQPLLCATGKR
jgi:hypothetical protein